LKKKCLKSTIKAENPNKLVQEQKDAQSGKLQSTIIREVIGGKLVTVIKKIIHSHLFKAFKNSKILIKKFRDFLNF